MRVIGYLLGIPEQDQHTIKERLDEGLRLEEGKEPDFYTEGIAASEMFADYVEWRAKHPSDDLMTQLLNAEFEDETGDLRTLTRQEVLTYVQLLAGAGNETTTRLIGWTGKLLGEHADQRRELTADRSLIPNAIEEILRYEAPSPVQARYVARDVEHYGKKIAEGSIMVLLNGSANRDERRFEDPDRFDVHRNIRRHLELRVRHPSLPGSCSRPPRRTRGARRGAEAGSPTGRSTTPTPSRPALRQCAAGRASLPSSPERQPCVVRSMRSFTKATVSSCPAVTPSVRLEGQHLRQACDQ